MLEEQRDVRRQSLRRLLRTRRALETIADYRRDRCYRLPRPTLQKLCNLLHQRFTTRQLGCVRSPCAPKCCWRSLVCQRQFLVERDLRQKHEPDECLTDNQRSEQWPARPRRKRNQASCDVVAALVYGHRPSEAFDLSSLTTTVVCPRPLPR